jgi:hypothetical protein
MTVVCESLHRSGLLSEETVTLRVNQECSADRKVPEVNEGQVQEEELDSCRAAGAGEGRTSGMRVQGEAEAGSPCLRLERRARKRDPGRIRSRIFSECLSTIHALRFGGCIFAWLLNGCF